MTQKTVIRFLVALMAAIMFSAILAGCGNKPKESASNAASADTPAGKLTKVRVGYTVSTDPNTIAFVYAQQSGAFEKAGLDVEVKSFVQTSQMYDTFKAGELDVLSNMGVPNAAQLLSAGVPLKYLRVFTRASQYDIVVRKDSPLQTLEDFKGKKLALVAIAGVAYSVSRYAFKIVGVDMDKEISLNALPPAAMITALEKGDVDGAIMYNPNLFQALKTGKYRVLANPNKVYEDHFKDPFYCLGIGVSAPFYEQNKEAMAKFITVMEETIAKLPENLDAVAAAVAAVPDYQLNAELAKEMIEPYLSTAIIHEKNDDPIFLKKVQTFYDRLYDIGQIKQKVNAKEFWVKP